MERRVVVTGIGVLAPGGIGQRAFWDLLAAGRTAPSVLGVSQQQHHAPPGARRPEAALEFNSSTRVSVISRHRQCSNAASSVSCTRSGWSRGCEGDSTAARPRQPVTIFGAISANTTPGTPIARIASSCFRRRHSAGRCSPLRLVTRSLPAPRVARPMARWRGQRKAPAWASIHCRNVRGIRPRSCSTVGRTMDSSMAPSE